MERIVRFLLGPLCVLGGFWFIALPLAFAGMSFGDPEAPPGWSEYLGEVLRIGVPSIAFGLVLVVGGLYLASTRLFSSGPDDRA